MNSFDFSTLFLDSVYKDTFERYCIRKRLITKTFDESHSSDISDLELIKTPLKGIKKLLVWLTLFEYVDSNSSIYDFTKLIDGYSLTVSAQGLFSHLCFCQGTYRQR